MQGIDIEEEEGTIDDPELLSEVRTASRIGVDKFLFHCSQKTLNTVKNDGHTHIISYWATSRGFY